MAPCSTKMRRTTRALAPMVFRMAMSRLFSMTSMMSDETMFRVATSTIRPMAIEMAIFSRKSASKSCELRRDQSSVR